MRSVIQYKSNLHIIRKINVCKGNHDSIILIKMVREKQKTTNKQKKKKEFKHRLVFI